ncbi:19654_t:CDS:2 [Rhizophagus irregularis]|nr:19654_t:CDS:2 [Rhizophagus irregularis]
MSMIALLNLQVIEASRHIYGLESFHKPTDVPVFALHAQVLFFVFWKSGYYGHQNVAKVADV